MTLCGVIILTVPLSMKMKLSIFLPNFLHNRTVPAVNQLWDTARLLEITTSALQH